MDVYDRAAWGARPPKSTTPMGTPEGFVIHWVGSSGMNVSPSHDQTCATLRGIQAQEMAGEYVDIAYNWAIDPSGRCYELRSWQNRSGANGTTSSNTHAWAVVYVAGPGVPLTEQARQSFRELTRQGAARHGAVSYVRPHRAIIPTACPGDELAAFCADLTASLRDGGPVPPRTPTGPSGGPVRPVLRQGARGQFVVELQQLLNKVSSAGLTADGIFGPRTAAAVKNFQSWCQTHGIDTGGVDAIVGPRTWRVLTDFAAFK